LGALRAGRDAPEAAARLRDALALYRGEFLAEESAGDWHLDVRDPADRRAGTLRLTPRGRREFARQSAAHEGWIAELLAGLAPAEQASLHRLLGRAKEGARAAIGEGSG